MTDETQGALEALRLRCGELERENAGLRLTQESLEATRASEAWFRSVFTNVNTAIAATDRHGRVTHFNDAFLALLDYDAETMVFFEEILARKREHYRLTKRYIARGGRVLWVDLSVAVIRDAQGEVANFVAVIDDVTALWRARAELERTSAHLAAELREKETLLREVHHRVKNNLQVISSLLSLQATQSSDEGVRSALGESGARVQAMALVHEHLYRSARLSSIDLGEHLSALARMVFESSRSPGLTLRCELDSMDADVEQAMPLGLILNELISNACKHAFKGCEQGVVSVRLRRFDSRLELVVADDGRGLPPGFELGSSASLGLRIVGTLSRQLRATMSLEQAQGTCIRLVMDETRDEGSRI